jgi:hypothetical protein
MESDNKFEKYGIWIVHLRLLFRRWSTSRTIEVRSNIYQIYHNTFPKYAPAENYTVPKNQNKILNVKKFAEKIGYICAKSWLHIDYGLL